jgi:putative component of toxin-antitoxin plasmid stabilization module
MVDVREYLDTSGRSPYAAWFDALNAQAAAKVATAVTRIGQGNFSNLKSIGSGFTNTESTLDPVTGFISAGTENIL